MTIFAAFTQDIILSAMVRFSEKETFTPVPTYAKYIAPAYRTHENLSGQTKINDEIHTVTEQDIYEQTVAQFTNIT